MLYRKGTYRGEQLPVIQVQIMCRFMLKTIIQDASVYIYYLLGHTVCATSY